MAAYTDITEIRRQFNTGKKIYKICNEIEIQGGETLILPPKITLDFQGGLFTGSGTLEGNNTKIKGDFRELFGSTLNITGTWDVVESFPQWFTSDGVLTTTLVGKCARLSHIINVSKDFDLNGGRVEVPANTILKFEGGCLRNGTLVGNDTVLFYYGDKKDAIANNVTLEGTFRYSEDIEDLQDDIDNLNDKINLVNVDIDAIEGDIVNINTHIGTVEGKVNTNTNNIATINTKLNGIDGSINNMNSDIDRINNNVNILSNALNTNVHNVATQVSANTADITALNGNVSAINEDIVVINGKIDAINSTIIGDFSEVTRAISANTRNITALSGSVTTITSDVNDLKVKVSANTDDIESLNLTMNDVTTAISANTRTISAVTQMVSAVTDEFDILKNVAGVDVDSSSTIPSRMGRVTLMPNIVEGTNVLTQDMISTPNTIYTIQYDFNMSPITTVKSDGVRMLSSGAYYATKTISVPSNTKVTALDGAVFIANDGSIIGTTVQTTSSSGNYIIALPLPSYTTTPKDISYTKSSSVTFPQGCVLNIEGGSINNGTLVGQDTIISYYTPKEKALNGITLSGTWKYEGDIEENIGTLDRELTGVEEQMSAIALDVSNLKNDVSGNTEDISDINDDITTINRNLTGITSDIHYIQTGITSIRRELTGITNNFNNYYTTGQTYNSAVTDQHIVAASGQTIQWVKDQNYLTTSNLNNYATKTYVNSAITTASGATIDWVKENIATGGTVDLSNYYTTGETYNRTQIDNKIKTASGATIDWVKENIATGGTGDLSNYYNSAVTDQHIATSSGNTIQWVKDQNYLVSENLNNYATKTYVNSTVTSAVTGTSGATIDWVKAQDYVQHPTLYYTSARTEQRLQTTTEGVMDWVDSNYASDRDVASAVTSTSGATIDWVKENIATGGTVDLSNYYTTGETYNRTQIDNKDNATLSSAVTAASSTTINWVTHEHYAKGSDVTSAVTIATGQTIDWVKENIITGGTVDLSNYYTSAQTDTLLDGKQATLVSSVNIKTINGKSVLGSGDLQIASGGTADLSALEYMVGVDVAPSSTTPSHMGRVILKSNIVSNTNRLVQEMINTPNTIYTVQEDYTLNNAILVLPYNSVLEFDGGTLSNGTLDVQDDSALRGLIFNNVRIRLRGSNIIVDNISVVNDNSFKDICLGTATPLSAGTSELNNIIVKNSYFKNEAVPVNSGDPFNAVIIEAGSIDVNNFTFENNVVEHRRIGITIYTDDNYEDCANNIKILNNRITYSAPTFQNYQYGFAISVEEGCNGVEIAGNILTAPGAVIELCGPKNVNIHHNTIKTTALHTSQHFGIWCTSSASWINPCLSITDNIFFTNSLNTSYLVNAAIRSMRKIAKVYIKNNIINGPVMLDQQDYDNAVDVIVENNHINTSTEYSLALWNYGTTTQKRAIISNNYFTTKAELRGFDAYVGNNFYNIALYSGMTYTDFIVDPYNTSTITFTGIETTPSMQFYNNYQIV